MVTIVFASDEYFSTSLPGCNSTCGNVTIPYPFGISNSSIPNHRTCFIDPNFELTCENDTLVMGNIPILNISILEGQIEMKTRVSSYCNSTNHSQADLTIDRDGFSVSSSENKFISVGCDTFGYIESIYNDEKYTTGCVTICNGNRANIENGTCSGIGCCQVDIPHMMKNISRHVLELTNSTESGCSYSFIVKDGSYTFSVSDLDDFPYERLPLIVDWSVGNKSCKASMVKDDYACKKNSVCYDKDIDNGYQCKCKDGYEGNPYHPDGCKDKDECKTNNTCITKENCHNLEGGYQCICPDRQPENATFAGGCKDHRQLDLVTKILIGTSAVLIVLFVAISSLYLTYQKRKLIKLKQKFFQQNGGSILLQQLSTGEDSSQSAHIFTEEELKKATKNYDESLIIGRGGFGTVFKGILPDNKIVAVKKSKIIDASQIEQFINEVVVLSQINHRNVVKLLGCCLETEVPSLVYEFVSHELLTGDKPLTFNRPEESISLSMHFLSCLKQDKIFEAIQVGILNDDNKKDIKEVAILAARCLRLRGDERPSMKEVAMELEGIRLTDRHPWTDTEQNFEENQRLLHEASSSIYNEIGDDSSNFGYTTVYDSLKDQPLIALDDGR
ncbi:hypothetical protein P8452_00879 [Trifolium repens]|nr:hypothetical protein P8452_00879 [Trifolium repens]